MQAKEFRDLEGKNINPFERMPIEKPLDVGVKAINALLSIGTGQRMDYLPVVELVKVFC